MTEQPWQRRQLAGFWLRVAAVLVDAVVAVVAFAALVLLASPVLETLTGETPGTVVVVSIAGGVLALAALLYDVLMTAGAGGTLGKRATGVEVRTADGQRVEVGRALGRSLARLVSIVIVLLGLLWVTWDRRKQGWHDKLAGTMVVKRRHLPLSLRDPEAPWWATAAPAALPAGTPVAAEEAPVAATQELGWAAGTASARGAWTPEGGDEPADARWAPSATAQAGAGADPAAAATEPGWSDAAQPSAMGGTADDDALAASSFFAGDQASASALDDTEPEAAGGPAAAGAPGGPSAAGPSAEPPPAGGPEPPPAGAPETSAFRELFDDEPAQPRSGDAVESAASGPGGPDGPGAADPNWGGPGDTDTGTAAARGATAGTGAGVAAGVAGQEPAAAAPAGDGAEETDPNLVAIHRAGLADDATGWLEQVAAQVDPRLDQVSAAWRQQEQAPAARACAFGLLLGHLATLYPHMADDLHRVAEAHPSFSTLMAGSRLTTLQQIADDPARTAAWLGPLMGVRDQERVARLLQ